MIRSSKERLLWAQFDALQLGSGWDEEDIEKPQILVEDVFGDSHPGSVHLNQVSEQVAYGIYEKGGKPGHFHVTDICDGCAQGHDGMNLILASREVICDMVEMHAGYVPWDGMVLSSSCDKSIPAHLKAMARVNIPAVFVPGGSMRPGPNQTTSLVAGDISLRQKRKDAITPAEIRNYKRTGCPSVGACTFMGTASTMQCMAEALGLAFQTRDDMLDVLGDAGKMGKATGMDENKNTFVRLYGVGACSRLIEKETQKSIEALGVFEDSEFLKELSMKLAIREC